MQMMIFLFVKFDSNLIIAIKVEIGDKVQKCKGPFKIIYQH